MIEVLRDALGDISGMIETPQSPAAAAAATWARVRRDVLPGCAAGWRVVLPIRVGGLGPEEVEAFGGELLRLARLDASAWSGWEVIGFTINGGPPLDCRREEDAPFP